LTGKRRKVRKPRVDPAAVEAWIIMFEDVFLKLMQGIMKATSVESDYDGLQPEVRQLTQQEMHRIAHVASERFVDLAYGSLAAGSTTKQQIGTWKREAIEHALRKRK
jgi:hypothetical protein